MTICATDTGKGQSRRGYWRILPAKPAPDSGRGGFPGSHPAAAATTARLCDLDRMVEAGAEAGAFYQAGNVDRVRPQNWAARATIAQGAIGEVRHINCYTHME